MSQVTGAVEERQAVLRRLEAQRQRMEYLLSPEMPAAARLGLVQADGFPRSQTMRLLMNEPMILAGLSSLAVWALGPRMMTIARAFSLAFRTARMFGPGARRK